MTGFAGKDVRKAVLVISSDILLSATNTPLRKNDKTPDHVESSRECGERERQQAQAPPSELRHFLLGYPLLVTSEGKEERWWRGKSECKSWQALLWGVFS